MRRDSEEVSGVTAFTVWRFDDPEGAERAAGLLDLAPDGGGSGRIVDRAVVTWPDHAASPVADCQRAVPAPDGAGATLRSMLADVLLTVPVVGDLVAALGARRRGSGRAGIPREDVTHIRGEVTPGSSALFLVTADGDLDGLGDGFRKVHKTVIHSSVRP